MKYTKYLLLLLWFLFHWLPSFSSQNKFAETTIDISFFETTKQVSLQNAMQQSNTNHCTKQQPILLI